MAAFLKNSFLFLLVVIIQTVVGTLPVRYTYNSSDLSYLSNGIQFPAPPSDVQRIPTASDDDGSSVEKMSDMQWISSLYNHHKWQSRLKILDNAQCREDMATYIQDLHNGTSWATKMYDASGRYSGLFLFGNDYWLGSSILCLELTNSKTNPEIPPFAVSFYVAKIRVNINRKLTPVTRQLNVGQCLPRSCQPADVRTMLAQERNQEASVNIVGVRSVPGDYSLLSDVKVHIVGGCAVAVGVIIVLASLVEVILKRKLNKLGSHDSEAENNNNEDGMEKSKKGSKEMVLAIDPPEKHKKDGILLRLLLAFSAIDNGRKILSVESAGRSSIHCIHGLRFFSIAWIILVHTYLEIFSVGDNKSIRILTERSFMYQTISNATFSVDTFFFISGLLVTITFFRSEAKKPVAAVDPNTCQVVQKTSFKFLLMIVYRFFRLTPAYLFVLGVNEIILRYLHSNSVFSPAIIDHISCSNFWWRNALYINNFYPQTEFCMLWSWYIANDTQFFVVATILLLIAVRGPRALKFAAVSIGVLMVSSWITTFLIAMKFDYVTRVEEPFALFDQLYDKPWMRIGPYLVGMMTGYFMFKVDWKIKLSPYLVILGWVLSLLCLASLVYGVGTNGLVVPVSAFYVALGHTAWGLSLAWITIACYAGYGGPLNSLFSCRLFLPLSRLTYCAYLIHPVLMCLTSFIMDGTLHLHHGFAVVIYSGNLVLSFLSAFVISLAFEAPVVNLLKIIF